ncbi:hypothetical protein GQ53DRAFT_846306 [Thozetella sp. PMI_491]|nr:hypothetical protein GQ53DRAFT_846306 [Thozetella sp. PMI_491]
MTIKKRCLLWDYTNTRDCPHAIDQLFSDKNLVFRSVSNWNAWYPQELAKRLPFYPQVRTPAQLGGDEWTWLRDGAFPYDTILFYNEPERQNISAADAAEKWHSQMVGVLRMQKGKKLIGPSCASDDAGTKWLADFMVRMGTNRPDFLGLHYYGTDPEACKRYLTQMHDKYHLPVVVSEIACIDRDAKKVEHFTAVMANWMDKTDWVHEYAFFGCMRHVADNFVSPAAQLMDQNGKFTPLMKRLMTEQPMKE